MAGNGATIDPCGGKDESVLMQVNRRADRAVRRFNLTHMNRGRNAYQASHCYSLADLMLGD